MPALKRILREPLLQFLVLGSALFAINGLLSQHTSSGRGSIVVTQGRIESLATAFGLTWQRPPTTTELEGLIRDYVRDGVVYASVPERLPPAGTRVTIILKLEGP